MKNKATRVRKFRGYAPERAVAGEKGMWKKVGVKKGYGPMHAENALEGEEVEPLKLQRGESDAPRRPLTKAELEKEEPELRDMIKTIPWREPHPGPQFNPGAGSPAESAMFRQLYDRMGELYPEEQLHPDFIKLRRELGMDPVMAQGGRADVRGYQGGTGGINYNRLTYGPGSPGATRSDLGQVTGSYDNRLRPGDIAVSPSGGFPTPGPNSYWTDPVSGQTYHVADYSYISPGQPTAAGTWEQWYGSGSGSEQPKPSGTFWDYMNPWGGTTKGGEGTGVPTQKAVGTAVGTATNVFIPGLGYVTGPVARWITSKLQGGMSKGDIGRVVARAQAKAPTASGVDVTTGDLADVQGTGVVQAKGFGGWYSPNYLRSIGYQPGQGTGSLWTGGPIGGFGGGGIGGQGGSFFGQLPGVRGGPLAGGGSGASGPSNLNWGGAAFGGEGTSDRPHFNPFFGGYNANMPSKGVAVALRAKGDSDLTAKNTDTVPAMLTPREAVLNRNAAELAGRGNIEQLNAEGNKLAEKGVDLAGGKNMKTKAKKYQGGDDMVPLPAKAKNPPYNSIGGGVPSAMPPDQIGGMPQPMRARGREFGQDWISGHPMFHQNWVQDPSGGWMARRGGAGAWGQQHPVAGGGGGGSDAGRPPYPTQVAGGSPYGYNPTSGLPNVPPGGWNASNSGYTPPDNRVRGGGFYPKGMGMQSGTQDVPQPIGSPNPQHAYGPPITLTAPQLQQAAQKAGLSGGQIQGLMSAVQGFGQAYSGMSGGLGGGGTGGMDAAGAFQGGISDIGYPPFVAPNAEYHADKGSSWIGRYDPAYTLPIY